MTENETGKLTTSERWRLIVLCKEAEQVIDAILRGAQLADPIGFAHIFQEFTQLARKAAGDPTHIVTTPEG